MVKVYVKSGYVIIDGRKVKACCLRKDIPKDHTPKYMYELDDYNIYTNYEDKDLTWYKRYTL